MMSGESRGVSFSPARKRRIAFESRASFPVRSYTKNIPFHAGFLASAATAPVERFRLVASLTYPSVNEFSKSAAYSSISCEVNFRYGDFSAQDLSMFAAFPDHTPAQHEPSQTARREF